MRLYLSVFTTKKGTKMAQLIDAFNCIEPAVETELVLQKEELNDETQCIEHHCGLHLCNSCRRIVDIHCPR
jgi:hypothetical protein